MVFVGIFVHWPSCGHVWITETDVWEFDEQMRSDVSKAQVLGFDHYGELMRFGRYQPQQGALWMCSQRMLLKGVESKGITPTIVLPITANYSSVTQLGEWLMAF